MVQGRGAGMGLHQVFVMKNRSHAVFILCQAQGQFFVDTAMSGELLADGDFPESFRHGVNLTGMGTWARTEAIGEPQAAKPEFESFWTFFPPLATVPAMTNAQCPDGGPRAGVQAP